MTPQNPWLRLFAGIVAGAIAIRITIDLLRPVLGFLIAGLVIVGVVVALRWWQRNRW